MRIRVRRSGGFTAVPRTFELDVDSLDPTEASEIHELAGSIRASDQAAGRSDAAARDDFEYLITISDAGGDTTLPRVRAGAVSPEVRRLIDHVIERSRGETP
jgi:hypothetical protein